MTPKKSYDSVSQICILRNGSISQNWNSGSGFSFWIHVYIIVLGPSLKSSPIGRLIWQPYKSALHQLSFHVYIIFVGPCLKSSPIGRLIWQPRKSTLHQLSFHVYIIVVGPCLKSNPIGQISGNNVKVLSTSIHFHVSSF